MKGFVVISETERNVLFTEGHLENINGRTSKRNSKTKEYELTELGIIQDKLELEEAPFAIYVSANANQTFMEPYESLREIPDWIRWSCASSPVILELEFDEKLVLEKTYSYGVLRYAYLEKLTKDMVVAYYKYDGLCKDDDCYNYISVVINSEIPCMSSINIKVPRIGGISCITFYEKYGWLCGYKDMPVKLVMQCVNKSVIGKIRDYLNLDEMSKETEKKLYEIIKDRTWGEVFGDMY